MVKKYGVVLLMAMSMVSTAQAEEQGQHKGGACCHLPGAQMLYNPSFGDDIYHNHPTGMWMFNYKYMHMAMDGLRDGTTDVPASSVGFMRGLPSNRAYMMIPTTMTMDMHMVMAMYGLNDQVTVMGMGTFVDNRMEMLMDMGPTKPIKPDDPMRSSGLGDTELRGIYKFADFLNASLGVSLPTGDIDQDYTTMKKVYRSPYDMQLGSGTFDLKPAVTVNFLSDDALWNWGGQAMATLRLGKNENDYSLGDSLKVNTWLQRALGPAAAWIRLSYSDSRRIDGQDPEIQKTLSGGMNPSMPDADPNNYGGQRLDGFIGASLPLGIFSLGVEGGIPLYQNLNGLQMKNDWYCTVGIQAMF